MSKRRKARRRLVNSVRQDYHHILFQGRHWNQGWAKVLRRHRYCGAYIPKDTLHREIHSKVHDVPTPNGKDCKQAVEAINSWLEAGWISYDDPIEKKLRIIASCFRAKCPATTAILDWQREIVLKFYHRE